MSGSSTSSSLPSLADAAWLAWPGTRQVFAGLSAHGHGVRAVGGAVRNTLLGHDVKDVDFATTALPEEVMELAGEAGLKAVPTGIGHGTVTVVAESHGFEVTTLRKDVETYGRRAKVAYTDDWAADASRRDFTINALYADADGTLFDPLGGWPDIAARRVRFIGDAVARVKEDYLRILRFFRFSAELNAETFDAAALAACVREREGLDGLSGERVRAELVRLLAAEGALPALQAMFDHGLLVRVLGAVPQIPRLERLAAIEAALEREPDPVLRLAALAIAVREDAARLGQRLRLSNEEKERLERAAGWRGVGADMDEREISHALYKRGASGCRDAALMAWAESRDPADDARWQSVVTRIAETPVPKFPVQGADIVGLGVAEGPRVGDILKTLEARWIESGFTASREALLEAARELAGRNGQDT